jgi:hypothetical protein
LGKFAFNFGVYMKIAIGLLAPKEKEMPEGMGLLDEPMAEESEYKISKESNDTMTKALMETRHLGPKDPANGGNFWVELVEFWGMPEEETANRYCANCEYFDNSPEALEAMKVVPESEFDRNGGGRGFCHKYEFICHNLRVCESWEEAEEKAE